jgi:hypothetical protein
MLLFSLDMPALLWYRTVVLCVPVISKIFVIRCEEKEEIVHVQPSVRLRTCLFRFGAVAVADTSAQVQCL